MSSAEYRPTMYVVGDLTRTEFASVRHWLDQNALAAYLPDMTAALQRLATEDGDPDALLLVQSRTGEHRPSQLDRWRQFTDAPPILVYGSWSEGETRSGFPLPGVPRLAWYHFAPRMSAAWNNWESNSTTPFHTFRDTKDETRWSADLIAAKSERKFRAGIVSGSFDDAQAICEAFEAFGHQAKHVDSIESLSNPSFDLVLWDDSANPRQDRVSLQSTCASCDATSTPVVACMTFPRIEECERALELGCADIVAKPFQVADLLWSIEQAMLLAKPVKSKKPDAA